MAVATLLLCDVLQARNADGARLTVCALSFHGPEEIRVFKEQLPATDFDVLDLSPYQLPPAALAASPGSRDSSPWLYGLCRPDLRCDVVVFSSEFAGKFFGAYGVALSLADMEAAACQARCDGLFHTAREAFLLGCNTLATKDQDRRTPADYLEVLRAHGFDRATAERVVATRYGPLGPSFRESLRRVFMGVPRIYGFASVAPSGVHTAPLLERYFRTKGDYRRWLEQGEPAARNAELLGIFQGTGLVQATGLTRAEPAAADRDLICRLYDEREPVARRLGIIQKLLERPDFLAFLPTIQAFIDRHDPSAFTGEEARIFGQIQRAEAPRDEVLRLTHELGDSALRLELAHTARHLGWMSPDEFRTLAVETARGLLHRPLTSEVVDIMCEIPRHQPLRDDIRSDDLSIMLFENAEGIRMIDCIHPTDPRVSTRLVSGLSGPEVSTRAWAAYALSERLPLDEATLLALTKYLDDPSAEVRDRLQWNFKTQAPLSPAVRRALAARNVRPAEAPAMAERRRRWWFW